MNQTSLIFFNTLPPLDGLPSVTSFYSLNTWNRLTKNLDRVVQTSKEKKKVCLNEEKIFFVDHGFAGCALHVHGVN